jgi:hypothetical protein
MIFMQADIIPLALEEDRLKFVIYSLLNQRQVLIEKLRLQTLGLG